MSGAHTSGPWVVNPWRAQVDCGALSTKGGLLPVAQMLWPTDERSEAETEANARLIAAAPELLECLELASNFLAKHAPGAEDLLDRFEQVTAKATGGAA